MSIPLTTIFPPPTTYFSTITLESGANKLQGSASDVLLPSANATDRNFAFSPGLNCPASYTTVANLTVTEEGSVTETRAICCPVIGIPDWVGYPFLYNSDTTSWPWYSTLGCSLSADVQVAVLVISDGSRTIATRRAQINAYSVQIARQSSDKVASAVTTTLSTSTKFLAPTTSATSS